MAASRSDRGTFVSPDAISPRPGRPTDSRSCDFRNTSGIRTPHFRGASSVIKGSVDLFHDGSFYVVTRLVVFRGKGGGADRVAPRSQFLVARRKPFARQKVPRNQPGRARLPVPRRFRETCRSAVLSFRRPGGIPRAFVAPAGLTRVALRGTTRARR